MRTLLSAGLMALAVQAAAPVLAQTPPTSPQPEQHSEQHPSHHRSQYPSQYPGPYSSLTLDQALDRAISHSPALAAAQKEVSASEGALQQAGLWRNPTLSATVEDTRASTRTTTTTLDIPLELGGKRSARLSAAEQARAVAVASAAQARAQLQAQVVSAFFNVLVAQERTGLATAAAELSARALEAVQRRVTAGKVSPVEASRAGVDRAQALLELSEAQAEERSTRHRLATLLGEDQPSFSTVEADTTAPQRPAFAELVSRMEVGPALQLHQAELQRRRALVDMARSQAVPDMTLSIGAKRDNDLGRTQAVVGLSVPLPLFDRNQGGITEANRQADKAADDLRASRLELLAELQEASNRLAVGAASLQTLKDLVLPAAQQAHDVAGKGFEAGKFGFLEVLDAQRTLLQARTRYLSTLAAAWQAAAVIDRIVGR
ncbi:TolC family protein [Roseateles sp. SL47]|uniref:TolC family protein n=1 Tax=Roseateles sp. SL47 TaxID=2995138 RepID=UPI00226F2175|nr:TolC family protein [Roseateles sp. SL47]WAC71513.1 TolC family protein [Roseateles sp. SL47]